MSTSIDNGRLILNELHQLLEIEKKCRWWERWAIRNAIIVKLHFRLSELYAAVESKQ
jgi:hypothetical protein